MTVYVALLRGINVGGNRKIPMAELRRIVAEAGGVDVQTYIQSGNVVFGHRSRSASRLGSDLQARIEATTGLEVPVVVRTRDDLSSVVAANPYAGAEPTHLHVAFLATDPDLAAFDRIDRAAFLPEECVLADREIYLHLPDGMGRAKLPAALGRVATVTVRNWRTVTVLRDLADSSAG